MLLIAALQLLFNEHVCRKLGAFPFQFRGSFWRVILALAAVAQLSSGVLFYLEAQHYRFAGYHLYPAATMWAFAVSTGVLLTLAFRRHEPAAKSILIVAMSAFSSVFLLAIASSPLADSRSDMLPLIAAANNSLLKGQNPYHFYNLSHRVILTYLPATWMAFLPSNVLHLDMRYTTLLCLLITAAVIFQNVRSQFRREAAALLALFFCSPYLQYRHDIYTAPQWLCVIASLVLAISGPPLVERRLDGSRHCDVTILLGALSVLSTLLGAA